MKIHLSLIARSSDGLSRLSGGLPLGDESLEISTIVGAAGELATEIQRNHPDIVVAELERTGKHEFEAIEGVLQENPSTALIVVTGDRSPEFLMQAMRSGVREVVPSQSADGELKAAFARQLGRMKGPRGIAHRARVMAFVPAKGGSGSTFLATNLAYALAQQGRRVALLDLNLHFGDAHLFVSENRPSSTIADLSRHIQRLDGPFLDSSMMPAAQNLWLLPAPDSPERALEVKPDSVERIVALARSRFDFVFIDLGRILEAVSVRALDAADDIFVVLQQTLPFIHDARRLVGVLQGLGYAREKIQLVVNRAERGAEITIAEVEKAVGVSVRLQVPNSYLNVAYSINHGVPILKYAPRDPVAKALHDFAAKLGPAEPARAAGGLRRFAGLTSFLG